MSSIIQTQVISFWLTTLGLGSLLGTAVTLIVSSRQRRKEWLRDSKIKIVASNTETGCTMFVRLNDFQ
jgi:hypothetical protein